MKFRIQIKIISLSLASIFLLGANLKTGNNIEDEVQKLFNGLPVHKGIEKIIKNSNLKFRYAKSIYMLSSHENWVSKLDSFEYLESPTKEIKIELNQGSQEKENGCYNSSLRLFYQNEKTMEEQFFRIKENFEILGEKVDTETVISENDLMISQSVIVYFYKEKPIPNLSFSYRKDEKYNEYLVFINYQNCLKN